MNPDAPKTPREEMEAWLTALLLGELSDGEAAAVRELIKHDAEMAKLHDRLQQSIALLREAEPTATKATTAAEPLRLSQERRQRLLTAFKIPPLKPSALKPKPAFRFRFVEALAVVTTMVLLAALFLPALSKSKSRSLSRVITTMPPEESAAAAAAGEAELLRHQVSGAVDPARVVGYVALDASKPPPAPPAVAGVPLAGAPGAAPAEPSALLAFTPNRTRPAESVVVLPVPVPLSAASVSASSSVPPPADTGRVSLPIQYPAPALKGSPEDLPSGPNIEPLHETLATRGGALVVAPTTPPPARPLRGPIVLPPPPPSPPGEQVAATVVAGDLVAKFAAPGPSSGSVVDGKPPQARGFFESSGREVALAPAGATKVERLSHRFSQILARIPLEPGRDKSPPVMERAWADYDSDGFLDVEPHWFGTLNDTAPAGGVATNSLSAGTSPGDSYAYGLFAGGSQRTAGGSASAGEFPGLPRVITVGGGHEADDKLKGVRVPGRTQAIVAAPASTPAPPANQLSQEHITLGDPASGIYLGKGLTTSAPAAISADAVEVTRRLELAGKDGDAVPVLGDVPQVGRKLAAQTSPARPGPSTSAKVEPDVPLPRRASTNAPIPQPEIQTSENHFSTFSLNVSDVSFKLAMASLEKGQMPDATSLRSEEFINAFDYRDPEAASGTPIAFAWERARYPFAHNRDLLRFSIKTAAAGRPAGRPLNLVLLLDNSGSMERADRVQIIREALTVLAGQLQPQDKLSVVLFSRTARLVADGVSGDKAGEVVAQVSGLTPQGGTNLEEAMNLAHQTAAKHYLANGINRVVLLTDGAANLGDVEPESLKNKVETHRRQGIALDCFGIGWEGFNDDLLEVLSRNGDGRYGFINSPEEAATEFAGQLAGALQVAASDVKVQVEFNPRRVTSYRQIGYAKHQLTKEQFRDNKVDAAEIAAQEAGNALYTVEVNPAGEGPLGTVRVRYKIPGTTEYREQAWDVPYTGNAPSLEQSSPTMRLAASAAAFAEWLVASPFAGAVTPDRVLGVLSGVPEVFGADSRPRKLEWMIRQAKSIDGK